MRKIQICLLLATILWCAGHAAGQSIVPEKDNQYWNDILLTIPLNKKFDFLLAGQFRVGDNVSQFVDERWGFGFTYKAGKYLTLGQGFFQREARAPRGRREHEERLTLFATVRVPLGRFVLSNRNGFERRWRQPQVDAWRNRNRIQLDHPFTIHKQKFTFFVADEVFYDWSFHDWVRNRAAIGAGHTFNKHFTGELYYMRQNDGRSRPGDLHIIGTTMRFKL